MTTLRPRIRRALEHFHATHPWDHNAHYHRWILRRLPRRFDRALDVGSGSGDLARHLASRAGAVHGIDLDPTIVDRARELTDSAAPVTFTVGDALNEVPPGPHDVITCVAAIHHMPFSDALTCFRQHLAPGGTLVVAGVYRAQSRSDYLIDALAIPVNVATAWIKNKGRKVPRPASMTARTRPATMTFADIVRDARQLLPGARLRRRLFWRYTLVWHRHWTRCDPAWANHLGDAHLRTWMPRFMALRAAGSHAHGRASATPPRPADRSGPARFAAYRGAARGDVPLVPAR